MPPVPTVEAAKLTERTGDEQAKPGRAVGILAGFLKRDAFLAEPGFLGLQAALC